MDLRRGFLCKLSHSFTMPYTPLSVKFKCVNTKIVERGLERGIHEVQMYRGRLYKLKLMTWKELGPTESRKDFLFIYFAQYGVGRSLGRREKDSGTRQWSMKA